MYAALSESTSNMWNEILAQYDPSEKPEVLKHPTLKSTFFLAWITYISAVKSYFSLPKLSFKEALKTESLKRNYTYSLILSSLFNLLSPKAFLGKIFIFIQLPWKVIRLPMKEYTAVFDTQVSYKYL